MVEHESEPWWWAGEHTPGSAALLVAAWSALAVTGVVRIAVDPDPSEPLLWGGVGLVVLGVALIAVNVATLVAVRRGHRVVTPEPERESS